MNITRRFLLWGAAAVAAVQSVKPAAAALPPMPEPVPAWVPKGWLQCHGQSVSRKEYAKLFDVIGTTYGERDGETFVLPDMRGLHFASGNGAPLDELVATGVGTFPAGFIATVVQARVL